MFFVYLFIALIAGVVGGNWAKAKGQNPIVWGLLCALFPIALIALAVIANGDTGTSAQASEKWAVLKEVDGEIAAAAAQAAALGPQYEKLLAEKYVALNDKQYLPALLDGVRQQAAQRIANGEAAILSLTTPWGEVKYRSNPDGSVTVIEGMNKGKSFDSLAILKKRLAIA